MEPNITQPGTTSQILVVVLWGERVEESLFEPVSSPDLSNPQSQQTSLGHTVGLVPT